MRSSHACSFRRPPADVAGPPAGLFSTSPATRAPDASAPLHRTCRPAIPHKYPPGPKRVVRLSGQGDSIAGIPRGDPGVEATITEDAFPSVFAADVPADVTKILSATQRPLAAAAFEETAAAAAWKTKPAWALIAGADETIDPEVERFGAKQAGATVVELEGASHAVAVSRPKEVADLIRDAVRATS